MRKILLAVFVFAAMPLIGCGPEYPECEEDEDCKEVHPDEWCVNNLCVKCRNDQDCLVGQECRPHPLE